MTLEVEVSAPVSPGTNTRPKIVGDKVGVFYGAKQALFDVIRRTDAAVLLVSDETDELAVCDRVLVMFAGRIVREFDGAWLEHEVVAAMEGVGQ